MKKLLIGILIPVVMFGAVVLGLNVNYAARIRQNAGKMLYENNSKERNNSITALKEIYQADAMPVFGSSELFSMFGPGYPSNLFHYGNSDFNMILYGQGGMQSLEHAIALAALADHMPDGKVVLIVSPQWFTVDSVSPDAFASCFSERMYKGFVTNPHISYDTKRWIADRAEAILKEADPAQYDRVCLYDQVYLEKSVDPAKFLNVVGWDMLQDTQTKRKTAIWGETLENTATEPAVKAAEIDYAELLKQSQVEGEAACTNNRFYIEDSYYDLYIASKVELMENSSEGVSYQESPEYWDLELFLKVCKETGIQPLIVNVPVHGSWYDYIGFDREGCRVYYQKIRDLCRTYDAAILDFSEKEYEPYFLKDIMHLGWKGWVYLDEGVYRFSQNPGTVIEYPFTLHATVEVGEAETGNETATETGAEAENEATQEAGLEAGTEVTQEAGLEAVTEVGTEAAPGKTTVSVHITDHLSDVQNVFLETGGYRWELTEDEEGFLCGSISIEEDADAVLAKLQEGILHGDGRFGAGVNAKVEINVEESK